MGAVAGYTSVRLRGLLYVWFANSLQLVSPSGRTAARPAHNSMVRGSNPCGPTKPSRFSLYELVSARHASRPFAQAAGQSQNCGTTLAVGSTCRTSVRSSSTTSACFSGTITVNAIDARSDAATDRVVSLTGTKPSRFARELSCGRLSTQPELFDFFQSLALGFWNAPPDEQECRYRDHRVKQKNSCRSKQIDERKKGQCDQ